MSSGGIREKLKRTLSIKDKEPNFDEHDSADDETTGNLHREIEEAEAGNHHEGRPGSFLNRLISHGNKKTEEQLAREAQQEARAAH
ncbi:hypothetical protein CAC42_6170 [Sphaceloma murrayae]|uniref:Uncharacterized protein n=1 Tax=Sphaceloma murrayae TaxID=2082308 RepID=A0A2K1QTZ3_9PEZI|nr:hypothetical protein CAC42_6170 [Sphaceloma murrayae]